MKLMMIIFFIVLVYFFNNYMNIKNETNVNISQEENLNMRIQALKKKIQSDQLKYEKEFNIK